MIKVSTGKQGVMNHAPTKPNDKGIDGQTGRDESRPYETE
jgi:hypothetical protein